jgi:hypothetical protein
MATVEEVIETIEIDYVCDKCCEGRMRPLPLSEVVWADSSDDQLFRHSCNRCGHEFPFKVCYPTLAYRKKKQ